MLTSKGTQAKERANLHTALGNRALLDMADHFFTHLITINHRKQGSDCKASASGMRTALVAGVGSIQFNGR